MASRARLANGPEREALREKGQFWTPLWVAEAMVSYVLSKSITSIYDPAVGAGAFFTAAKLVARDLHAEITLAGAELHADGIAEAKAQGLTARDMRNVTIKDFVLDPPKKRYPGIVANPPYIRHHRLPPSTKVKLAAFSKQCLGHQLDGRTGYHVYFLLQALQILKPNGALAFIVPADTCEGIFAPALWAWITRRCRLEAVITFDSEASPFPGVDTNAIILLLRNCSPAETFLWARCHQSDTDTLTQWVQSGFEVHGNEALTVWKRTLAEGLATGLSRFPCRLDPDTPRLMQFARVMRGVATGANNFFFLTRERAAALGIPSEFLSLAIGRTRDVPGDEVTAETIRALEDQGRPTQLLDLDGRPLPDFPKTVQDYVRAGEDLGVHRKTLIATRRPWYKMERRRYAPILFSYLGRRNARFIRNRAHAVPLTGFLCVYPRGGDSEYIERVWQVLRHKDVLSNLPLVAKSYGGGALKVEPRALERLPIPRAVLQDAGLTDLHIDKQMELFGSP